MPPRWEDIERDPRYQSGDPAYRARVRASFERLSGGVRAPAAPEPEPEEPVTEGPSLTRRALAMALRIGGPVAGGTAGFFSPIPGGTYLGAAAGGAAGEAAAESVLGEDLDPREIALQAGVSAIPAIRAGKIASVGGRALLRAGEGAVTGAGTEVARSLLHGETPQAGDVVGSAALGGVFGAGAGALEAKLAARRAPRVSAPVDAPSAPVDTAAPPLPPTRNIDDAAVATPPGQVLEGTADLSAQGLMPGKGGAEIPEPISGSTSEPPKPPGPRQMPKLVEPPDPNAPPPPPVDADATPASRYFTRLPGDETIPPTQPRPEERYKGDVESVDRLFPGIAPETRQNLITLEQQQRELIGDRTRGLQSVKRTQAIAAELYPDLNKMLPKGTVPNDAQITAIGSAVGDLAEQADELAATIAKGTGTAEDKLRLKIVQGQLVNQVASFRGGRAELGRGLNILRYQIDALKSGDPKFIHAALKMGIDADKVAKALNAFPADNIEGRYKFLLASRKPTFLDYAKWYFFTSILSGPKTHERNLIGNTFNLMWRPASAPMGALVERLSGVPMEQRQIFAGEAPRMAYGILRGMPEGVKRALHFFKEGFSLSNLDDFEVRPPEVRGGIYTNFIGRSLGAADEFFKSMAASMELHGGAYAMAQREAAQQGHTGPALREFMTNRIQELTSDPPLSLIQQMKDVAERATFQEEGGKFVQALYKAREAFPLLHFLIPFVKTPANIFHQGLQASPIGFATKLGRESSRLGAQARGEAALGTALLAPIAMLAINGDITGSGPKDPKQLDRLRATGWQPNSIRIGDRWINYSLIQPLAVPMSIIANAFDAWRYGELDQPVDKMVGAIGAKVANSALQQSYLQGLLGAIEAINDPERKGAAFVRQYTTAAIPLSAAARTVRQLQDPTIRTPTTVGEGVGMSLPENVAGALGFETPQPKIRATGEVIKREPGLLGIPAGLAVPEVSKVKSDPLREEVGRLAQAGLMGELSIPTQRGDLRLGGRTFPITPKDGTALRQAQGQATRAALQRVIGSKGYQRMPDEVRADRLKSEIRRARDAVLERAKQLTAHRQKLTTEALIPPGMRRVLERGGGGGAAE